MATVVHVGYQKTASTTFRVSVFPRLPSCAFLGHHPEFMAFAQSVENDEDRDYPEARWHSFVESASATASTEGRTLLISREDFTKVPHWRRTAHRLRMLVPDARILICVRNQATMIPSLYSQYLKGGGYRGFSDWISTQLCLDWLQYDRAIACYHELFGRAAVKVMAYEQLRADPQAFLAEVCSYIAPGAPPITDLAIPTVNRRLSPPSRWVFRHANRLFRRSTRNPNPIIELDVVWRGVESLLYRVDPILFDRLGGTDRRDRELVERLLPTFAAGNVRLAELTGLPLDEYGYTLPANGQRHVNVGRA